MSDEEVLARVTAEAASAVAVEIYKDIRPIVKILGEIGRLVGVVPSVLADWAERVAGRIRPNVPPDKLVEPAKLVTVPIVRALQAAEDEPELRDMLEALLSKAMHADLRKNVHPVFAQMIQQLCPDEARILFGLHPTALPTVEARATIPDGKPNALPNASVIKAHVLFVQLSRHPDLAAPERITTYFENLHRLGIVARDRTRWADTDPLKHHPVLVAWQEQQQIAGRKATLDEQVVVVTSLGEELLASALPIRPAPLPGPIYKIDLDR